jgi:hypothetical protein
VKLGTGIFWAGLFLALSQCQGRLSIDCHDWTAQQCIEFVREVRKE